jgi:alkylation response protein AidB-like acyl-CoA dehydrogenase
MPADSFLLETVNTFLATHPPASIEDEKQRIAFLRARFDAGLAWVGYPRGLGGLGADPGEQPGVDRVFADAGAPDNRPQGNVIGLGMAAPTLLHFGTQQQQERWLRTLWTGEEIWCQLFSEPGAGSDLAAVSTSAERDGDDWVVSGQKVWTSLAHDASWALLLARTDPSQPKHRGLTYFVCDMQAVGVDVRPLRQITGEAEFSEVFLDSVRVPDSHRVGAVGDGWKVTMGTLMNERVAIGGGVAARESGPISQLVRTWRSDSRHRSPENLEALLDLWVQAEALRLASARFAQKLEVGDPGPDGSGLKLTFAALAQQAASLALDIGGADALRYDDWSLRRPDLTTPPKRVPAYWYLRNRANSIEGGTSEVLRNIIAERILGMPPEARLDRDTPWKELPR